MYGMLWVEPAFQAGFCHCVVQIAEHCHVEGQICHKFPVKLPES